MFTCSNPYEVGKPVYVSTKEQLADWLNMLATDKGVRKSAEFPSGYEAREQDWYTGRVTAG